MRSSRHSQRWLSSQIFPKSSHDRRLIFACPNGSSHRPVVKSRIISLDCRHRSQTIRFRSMVTSLEKVSHVKGLFVSYKAETVPSLIGDNNLLKLHDLIPFRQKGNRVICENQVTILGETVPNSPRRFIRSGSSRRCRNHYLYGDRGRLSTIGWFSRNLRIRESRVADDNPGKRCGLLRKRCCRYRSFSTVDQVTGTSVNFSVSIMP